jgi:hypothetical protein
MEMMESKLVVERGFIILYYRCIANGSRWNNEPSIQDEG